MLTISILNRVKKCVIIYRAKIIRVKGLVPMYHQTIPAYEGNSPFIYACFCSEDEDLAYPVLARMYNEGFRVFPAQVGSAASDFRASQRLNASSHVILFMSAAMNELMRRESGKVAAVLRSSCLRTVILLDEVNPSNDIYALSAPDRVSYNPMNDSPFWLYIYNCEYFEKCRGSWPEKKLKIGAPEFEDVSETTLGEEYDLLSDIIRRGTPMRESAQIAFTPVMQEIKAAASPVGGFEQRPLDSDVSEVVGMIDLHLEQTANMLVKPEPEPVVRPEIIAFEPEPAAEPEIIAEPETTAEEMPEPEVVVEPAAEPEAEVKADVVIEVSDEIPEPEPVAEPEAEEPEIIAEPVAEETEPQAEEIPEAPVAAAEVSAAPGQSQVNVVVRVPKRRTKTKVIAKRRAAATQPPLHLHSSTSVTAAQPVRQPEPVVPEAAAPAVQQTARRHRARPMPSETPVVQEPAAIQPEPLEITEQTAEQQPTARKNRHEHNRLNLRRLMQLARNAMKDSEPEEAEPEQAEAQPEPEETNNAPLCAAVSRFLCAYSASTVTVIPRPALQQRQK